MRMCGLVHVEEQLRVYLGFPVGLERVLEEKENLLFFFDFFFFLMRLYRALRGCSCGSRGFRRGPDDGHNHRQGATSSTSRVTSLQGQSGARTAWAISVRSPRAETARC